MRALRRLLLRSITVGCSHALLARLEVPVSARPPSPEMKAAWLKAQALLVQLKAPVLNRLDGMSADPCCVPRYTRKFVWNEPIALEATHSLLKLANELYRVLLKILAARPRTSTHDSLITHWLSRLHMASPPEKRLPTTTSSATNPSWRQTCVLSPGMSGLRLPPI
jgi:hypothetical protein